YGLGSAEVTGDIEASMFSTGVDARWDSGREIGPGAVTVTGNVTAGTGVISEGGEVDITGNVTSTGTGGTGVFSSDGGEVTVTGDVSATGAGYIFGVRLDGGESIGRVTVGGSVTALPPDADEEDYPVGVSVYIDRSGLGNYDPEGEEPTVVTVEGNVEATRFGLSVRGGLVRVFGNVTSHSTFGVEVVNGEAVVDGEIFGLQYVDVGNSPRLIENPSFIDDNGYRVYQNYYPGSETYHIVRVGGSSTPLVVTNAAASITTSSARLTGNVVYSGSGTITERGFVYGAHAGPTTGSDTKIPVGAGAGAFETTLSGLSASAAYYVRAYAILSGEVVYYGGEIHFTTRSPSTPGPSGGGSSASMPTVVTNAVTGVTAAGAALSGRVTASGGAAVTERGFVYGKTANPAIGGAGVVKETAGSGAGDFTAEIDGLLSGTTYHVRAFAANSKGTAYGADVSFTTDGAPSGEIGYLDAPGANLSDPYGNVVRYTDEEGNEHILGLGVLAGSRMKYVSRGPGQYEVIYNARPFDDIAGHWAKNDIDFASARLLFNGVAPRLFSPDAPMTRGMFAAVLGRMCGIDSALYAGHSFDDVPVGAYYAPYVKWAAENGIILGASETAFEPERAVTRQEMAAMVYRFMLYLGLEFDGDAGAPYDDAQRISGWALESVAALRDTGIFSGKSANLFDPGAPSTRAEVATVLRRLIEHILK
ncbi:MAG TPA: S-layer homology domain-containing protein, partial [Terriglobales bacterium]|nr:S-layer homology domain-containing protein [Terriglobales bacterium]